MATGATEESNVTYEQLADLEREFDDVEVQISKPFLYLMIPRVMALPRALRPVSQLCSLSWSVRQIGRNIPFQ